jgi:hypothetical protein
VLIFGFGPSAPRDHGPAVPLRCPNCGNDVEYRYAVSRSWFRLFFIPVIPYSRRHLLMCPVCSRGLQLTREQGAAAADMVAATAARRSGTLDAAGYDTKVHSFLASISASRSPTTSETGRPPGATGLPASAPTSTPVPPASAQAAPPPAPAGWYPDPYGTAEQRYWDGTRWTDGTIPAA